MLPYVCRTPPNTLSRAAGGAGSPREACLQGRLLQRGPVKVQAAGDVRVVLQQPHHVPRAEVHVVQEHHAARRPGRARARLCIF